MWYILIKAKKTKWTREFVDEFFEENVKPHIKGNKFPITSWFKGQWWEYWGFIWVLNSWRIEWYNSVKDFREKRWLVTWKNPITKEMIDKFYNEEVKQYVEGDTLPSSYWFRNKGGKFSSWYTYLSKVGYGYSWVQDFCRKNWLKIKSKWHWNKQLIDEFFKDMIKPLMEWNKLLPYSLFKELDWKYLEWYNTLRAKRVKWYSWIIDFKKKHKLK